MLIQGQPYTHHLEIIYIIRMQLKMPLHTIPQENVPSVPPLPINPNIPWDGFPQYPEFDLIRTDNDVSGYTIGNGRHLDFKSVSATTYNWSHYLSYAFANEYNKKLYAIEPNTNISWNWTASDGIPYVILFGSDQNNKIY
jgi:hypothetical protein